MKLLLPSARSQQLKKKRSLRGRKAAIALGAFLTLAFACFVALGIWQVQRMAWKHALIERVEARIHADPVDIPARVDWPQVSADSHGYRRVEVRGQFVPAMETGTQAVTALGAGRWVLAPLQTDGGDYVLVNRGFVPSGADATPAPSGPVTITGLLRITEPGGGFLRDNVPQAARWYSRDVAAIAQAHGLPAERVAPFFIDAERDAAPGTWPRGGMTVVAFRDSHRTYALTWFGMALLTLVAGWRLVVSGRRLPQDRRHDATRSGHARTLQPR